MHAGADRWTPLRRLGVGGMAEVWLATGPDGVQVALKRMLPSVSAQPEHVAAFLQEARLLGSLRHPNVVRVLDAADGADPWIALELVRGVDLTQLVRAARQAGRPLPLELVGAVAADVLSALEAVHAAVDDEGKALGLVHRDVSPQNLLLSMDGSVKLLDFGVAKSLDQIGATQAGIIKGKLLYMPPEQLLGAPAAPSLDLWAAALVIYELATLQHPFRAPSEGATLREILKASPLRPSAARPDLPPALDELLVRALTHDPARRPPSATSFRKALAAILPPPATRDRVAALLRELFPEGPPQEADHGGRGWKEKGAGADPSSLGAPGIEVDLATVEQPVRGRPNWILRAAAAAAVLVLVAVGLVVLLLPGRAGPEPAPAPTPAPSIVEAPPLLPVPPQVPPPPELLPAELATTAPASTGPAPRRRPRAGGTPTSRIRIAIEPWAAVSVDGRPMGMTPLPPIPVSAGPHVVMLENPELGIRLTRRVLVPPSGEVTIREVLFAGKQTKAGGDGR